MVLPKVVQDLIQEYAASMEEYDRRRRVHEELVYKYFFNNLHKFYSIFLEFVLI